MFLKNYWNKFKNSISLLSFLLFFFLITSEASATEYIKITCDSTQWAQPGTYEIIVITGATEGSPLNRGQEILTSDQLCLIESSRHQTQIIELQLSPYTKAKIFPKISLPNTGPR